MFRVKLDLAAFNNSFHTPFWDLEKHGIYKGTVLEYAQRILAKYGISERYPRVYLDGAIVPDNQSSEIIRDGDLLQLVPSRMNLDGVVDHSAYSQAVVPYSQISHRTTSHGVYTRTSTTNAALLHQPIVPAHDTTSTANRVETCTDNQARAGSAVLPIELIPHGEETEQDNACKVQETTESKKRRKRGPRRRVRSKRTTPESDTDDQSTSMMDTVNDVQIVKWEQDPSEDPSGTSSPKTATEAISGDGGPSSTRSSGERSPDQNVVACEPSASQTPPEEALTVSCPRNTKLSLRENTSEEIAPLVTPDENQNSTGIIKAFADDLLLKTGPSSGVGVSSKSKPPMKKISARKSAKRSYGVGDLLRMLHEEGDNNSRSGDPGISESAPLHQSNSEPRTRKGKVDASGSRTELAPASNTEKPDAGSCQAKPKPPGVTATKRTTPTSNQVESAERAENTNVVGLGDLSVGSRLVAGLGLFSESDMGVRFFNDVTLAVTHLNLAKNQLYVKLEKGLLPKEYRYNTFKVDWSLLENVRLVS